MKRSGSVSLGSSSGAKRQASLADFFKPRQQNGVDKGKRRSESPDLVILGDAHASSGDRHGHPSSKPEDPSRAPSYPTTPYPPRDHPSYHLPPSPAFNHPIPIAPPPSSLVLAYNTVPRILTDPPDLDLLYFDRFIAPSCAGQLTKYLLDALPWYRVKYTVRGFDVNTPRYTTVFGKDSTDGKWGDYACKPRAIPEILLRLMQKVEEVTGETYNFTLVNYYSSGTDSISYHSDSESFLGPNPCIASLSLGAPRDFHLRHVDYKTNGVPPQKFVLHDGDMVVMRGKTQHRWQHAVPKRKHADGRINITFRKGVVRYATANYNQYNVGKGPMYRWEKGRMVEKVATGGLSGA